MENKDKDKELPNADSYIQYRFVEEYGRDMVDMLENGSDVVDGGIAIFQFVSKISHEYAILFAKWHREQALLAILEATIENGDLIKQDSTILNAYPENKIK